MRNAAPKAMQFFMENIHKNPNRILIENHNNYYKPKQIIKPMTDIASHVESAKELIKDSLIFSNRRLWKEFSLEKIEVLNRVPSKIGYYRSLASELKDTYSQHLA